MEKEIYNGLSVNFDNLNEVWYVNVNVNEDGTEAEYDSSDNRIDDPSLKKLKEKIDLLQRNKFERVKVFIINDDWRYRNDVGKKFIPKWIEAVITSISPNGNAFVVADGEKHSTKHRLKYSGDIVLHTPQNIEKIEKIYQLLKKKKEVELELEALEKKLEEFDGQGAFKEIYGKDLV